MSYVLCLACPRTRSLRLIVALVEGNTCEYQHDDPIVDRVLLVSSADPMHTTSHKEYGSQNEAELLRTIRDDCANPAKSSTQKLSSHENLTLTIHECLCEWLRLIDRCRLACEKHGTSQ